MWCLRLEAGRRYRVSQSCGNGQLDGWHSGGVLGPHGFGDAARWTNMVGGVYADSVGSCLGWIVCVQIYFLRTKNAATY